MARCGDPPGRFPRPVTVDIGSAGSSLGVCQFCLGPAGGFPVPDEPIPWTYRTVPTYQVPELYGVPKVPSHGVLYCT
jgi:hypothetical protein